MKKENMDVFCCDYCNKISKYKAAMLSHEAACRKNPSVEVLCYNCEHFINADLTEEIEYVEETFFGEFPCSKEMFPHRCGARRKKLYNRVRRESLIVKLGEHDWIQMPTVEQGCVFFKPLGCYKERKELKNETEN